MRIFRMPITVMNIEDRMSSSAPHRIGDAARKSGLSAANIRFYEKEELLTPHARGENSYRMYSDGDVHQLRFIRLCRALDMSLDEVRTLLGLNLKRKADCETARVALDGHLAHVRARLTELKALEKDLQALRNRCDGSDAYCHIIEALHERADALPSRPTPGTKGKRHV
jgi:DNA-binding transcriptional MerR regulator